MTPVTFLANAGSFSANQRSFVTVKAASGTEPVSLAQFSLPPKS